MKKYSEFQEAKLKTPILLAAVLSAFIASAPAHAEEPAACVLSGVAETTLQMAEQGMGMVVQLENAIDQRLTESKDAFKACEQDMACRTTDRLHVLENAFNQAHEQKQRVAKAHAEASERKAELEEHYKALKQQAVGCTAPTGQPQ
jgi:hypothetical protein